MSCCAGEACGEVPRRLASQLVEADEPAEEPVDDALEADDESLDELDELDELDDPLLDELSEPDPLLLDASADELDELLVEDFPPRLSVL